MYIYDSNGTLHVYVENSRMQNLLILKYRPSKSEENSFILKFGSFVIFSFLSILRQYLTGFNLNMEKSFGKCKNRKWERVCIDWCDFLLLL